MNLVKIESWGLGATLEWWIVFGLIERSNAVIENLTHCKKSGYHSKIMKRTLETSQRDNSANAES